MHERTHDLWSHKNAQLLVGALNGHIGFIAKLPTDSQEKDKSAFTTAGNQVRMIVPYVQGTLGICTLRIRLAGNNFAWPSERGKSTRPKR